MREIESIPELSCHKNIVCCVEQRVHFLTLKNVFFFIIANYEMYVLVKICIVSK